MALSKNLKRIGMAAHNERMEIADWLISQHAKERQRIHDETVATCQMIADLLPHDEYLAWIDSTPDRGFLSAAHAKLAELQAKKMDTLGLECETIQQWIKANWDAIPEVEV